MQKVVVTTERSLWWWVYFAVSASAYLWSMVAEHSSILGFGVALASGLSLVALWGFITSTAIGWQTFWRYYFILYVGGGIVGLVWVGMTINPQEGESPLLLALAALFALPELIALGLYAFRSHSIWGSEPNA